MKLTMSDDKEKSVIANIFNLLSEEASIYYKISKIKNFIADTEAIYNISGNLQISIIKIDLELISCFSTYKKEVYDYIFNKYFYKTNSWVSVNYYATILLNSSKENESVSKDEIKKYFNNFFRLNPYSGELFKLWSFKSNSNVEMWENFILGNNGNEILEIYSGGKIINVTPKMFHEIKFKIIKKLIKDVKFKSWDLFRQAFISFPELIRIKEYRIIKDVELLFSDKNFKNEFIDKNHDLFNGRFIKSFGTSIYNRNNQLFTLEELTSLVKESSSRKKDDKIWLKY
jgi:hypothetical protein